MSTKLSITGASSGIGGVAAARLGFRRPDRPPPRDRLEALPLSSGGNTAPSAASHPPTLSRMRRSPPCAKHWQHERIDLFINNAGFGACGAFPRRTRAGAFCCG